MRVIIFHGQKSPKDDSAFRFDSEGVLVYLRRALGQGDLAVCENTVHGKRRFPHVTAYVHEEDAAASTAESIRLEASRNKKRDYRASAPFLA